MEPIRTDYSNITYVSDGCGDLPATLVKHNGQEAVETVWELTDEEIWQVMKDRKIYLYIIGRSVPPVLLTTQSEIITAEAREGSDGTDSEG